MCPPSRPNRLFLVCRSAEPAQKRAFSGLRLLQRAWGGARGLPWIEGEFSRMRPTGRWRDASSRADAEVN